MTIYGLDISTYQEYEYRLNTSSGKYETMLTPIDWNELAKDERRFKFVFIKAAHGTAQPGLDPDAYPISSYVRNGLGAAEAGILFAPYHYWYWKIEVKRIESREQAKAFFNAVKEAKIEHTLKKPMGDIEDTSIFPDVEPVKWTTSEANRCLGSARKVLLELRIYIEEIQNLFKQEFQAYWGRWWWERLTAQVKHWFPQDLEYFKSFYSYNADYAPPMEDVPEWKINLWQFTSSPVPPVRGVKVLNGTRVDVAQWMQSEKDYAAWVGIPGTPRDAPAKVPGDALERLWKAHPELW